MVSTEYLILQMCLKMANTENRWILDLATWFCVERFELRKILRLHEECDNHSIKRNTGIKNLVPATRGRAPENFCFVSIELEPV